MNLMIRLQPKDGEAFHKAVDDLYDSQSPSYHRWMTDVELKQHEPSEQERTTVRKALESHGLKVLSDDQDRFSLRVSGSVDSVELAFHTSIHQFRSGEKTFQTNVTPARLSDESDPFISSIGGLQTHQIKPTIRRAVNIRTGLPPKPIPIANFTASGALTSLITDKALSTPKTYTFNTVGASLPVGVYYGNQYYSDPNRFPDFTAPQLQDAYGLTAAYKQGLDGKGQTIVLLEAFGDSHMETDANAFSSLNGIPKLSSSTFNVVYPEGKPANQDALASLTGWDGEIALDIEWSHAMAPGAKIVVVAAAGQDSEDFQDAMSYIIAHKIGYAVSDSWEEDVDLVAGPVEQQSFEDILELAAAKGVSFQFSTGDGGDSGLGTPLGAAGVPSDAPHATAIGGTSLLNNVSGTGFTATSWGDSFADVDDISVFSPPYSAFFGSGGGGGESTYFKKPNWQKKLPGTGRQTPDVSALADPYTGVPFVLTSGGEQSVNIGEGGTSLACPIFTAFWAIAQQKAGEPLGQAAQLIASTPGSVEDVIPFASPTDVTGEVITASGATFYSANDLFSAGLDNNTQFISGMWNQTYGSNPPFYAAIAFGLDTSLTVTKGWDNATGYGTPYGLTFIDAIATAAKKK